MKNYKVRATRNFNDAEAKIARTKDDEFVCTKERYEILKSKNAVELIEIIEEQEEIETNSPYEEDLAIEEEYKPRKKSSKK